MPQIFHRSANSISRMSIAGVVLLLIALLGGLYIFFRSPFITGVGLSQPQPVQFSHKHHVGDDGIDCRYCHTTVETSAFAGIPPTQTCMNCHSQIWAQSPALAPVRESWQSGQPLVWTRVHVLPGFVYFDHSIHVNKGVGCETCHGRVDQMPLMHKAQSLQMQWCIDCHSHPEQYVRPRDQVLTMGWQPPNGDQLTLGRQLVKEYNIESKLACSTCHR